MTHPNIWIMSQWISVFIIKSPLGFSLNFDTAVFLFMSKFTFDLRANFWWNFWPKRLEIEICPPQRFLHSGNLSLKPTAVQPLKANPIHSDVLVYWKSIGQKSKTQQIFSRKKIKQIKSAQKFKVTKLFTKVKLQLQK